jgi:hypothetical protein
VKYWRIRCRANYFGRRTLRARLFQECDCDNKLSFDVVGVPFLRTCSSCFHSIRQIAALISPRRNYICLHRGARATLPISPHNFFIKNIFMCQAKRESAAVEKREHSTLRSNICWGISFFPALFFCFLRFNVTEKMEKRRRSRWLRVKEGDVKKVWQRGRWALLSRRRRCIFRGQRSRAPATKAKNAPGGSLHKSRAHLSLPDKR